MVAGVGFERPCEKYCRVLRCKVLHLVRSYFSPATARFFRRVAALAFAAHSLRCPFVGDTKSDLTYQKNEKQHRMVLFRFLVAGVGFEPHDLRVMSPTSYQAALPRDIFWCRKPGSNRYGKLIPRDFKSRASASSATPAYPAFLLPNYYITTISKCQAFFESF